jgi:hypothetical protein
MPKKFKLLLKEVKPRVYFDAAIIVFFSKLKKTREGCPLTPYLFIIV